MIGKLPHFVNKLKFPQSLFSNQGDETANSRPKTIEQLIKNLQDKLMDAD